MKWEVEDVLEKVDKCESEKGEYRKFAVEWENMWRLQGFERSEKEAQEQGYEQISLPIPYNTVHLLMRLMADDPKIDCPARDISDTETQISEKKERWLTAMWQMVGAQQRSNPIANAKWQSGVRGLHAFEVKWIEDVLPKHLKERRFPIMIRNLDPLNVGVREGPLYTEYAYHKYDADLTDIFQRYPQYRKKHKETEARRRSRGRAETKAVVDFWYTDTDGVVYNCIVIEEEFVKKPTKMPCVFIPIVVGSADTSFSADKHWRSLSILHPIQDTWRAQNRLASMKLTQARWYADPHIAVMNEYGSEIPDIQVKPGTTQQYPWGTQINPITFQPNQMLTDSTYELLDTQTQQATFAGVLYGDNPGSLQAGYGVSLLSNSAKGRLAPIQYNLERSIEQVNAIAMSLVDRNCRLIGADGQAAEDDGLGVRVWGKRTGERGFFYETLFADDIAGYYENRVRLSPNVPQNDIQDQTLALRWLEQRIISREWYRDNMITAPISPDEKQRVLVEELMDDPTVKPKVMQQALQKMFPDTWQLLVEGTPFDPNQPPAQPEEGAQGQMGPEMGPMGGEMAAGMPMQQGPPPQMSQMQGPMPPPMPPSPQMPPMGMQMPSMNMDAGTFPPEMGAQLSQNAYPGMVDPATGQIDPVMWATLLGKQLPPAEQLPL